MKRKYLTQEEIEKLLSATDRMPFPERNRCLILMAFIHGFRASELLGLRLSDIDLAGRQLYIRRLKNGFSTCHPLLPDEYNVLKSWLRARKYLEKGAGRLAELTIAPHPHMLRHACGYALADKGIDTRLIQDYLGQNMAKQTSSITVRSDSKS